VVALLDKPKDFVSGCTQTTRPPKQSVWPTGTKMHPIVMLISEAV
jgi:hypothetical protein